MAFAVPFVHVIAYAVVVAGLTDSLPDVEVAVVHSALQPVAFVEFQVKSELSPLVIVAGLAVKDTVGAAKGHSAEAVADTLLEYAESPTTLTAITL